MFATMKLPILTFKMQHKSTKHFDFDVSKWTDVGFWSHCADAVWARQNLAGWYNDSKRMQQASMLQFLTFLKFHVNWTLVKLDKQ